MQRMDPYSRHKKFINDYVLTLGKEGVQRYIEKNRPSVGKTDYDVLHENYRFIRKPEEDDLSKWEVRMAVKYYEKLYKEYCIADMSKYKKGQIALRWRTEKEVFVGKGQFVCGNQACDARDELQSFEMNFAYKEAGEKKNALVKLRVCPDCAIKRTRKAQVRTLKNLKKSKKMKAIGKK
ncbi:hypothetical protein GUITHDRAFT_157639 [Guillardia theta CCMP2712]|uniref:Folate-sensitive fragile site protein Fra10Ac1 n=1 Tax=Guillardia theta (strain CCMP2712) TaxID=905079 RepID=L1JG07_GUITC|nr:hypothetical protein GUITHDRAFT_157639 [Guillardia theta CCMP2712]EKX47426.1 hypothetical protein GUITHDRAFT_157639 [Guillardia theta CCMP2712]|eukprot:XP_005834406.1 hypothetical protein GUITHDRAFT_157639 [Guillardia theta CCMP2712]